MKIKLGTISHGTMRNEDLIPAFADALEAIDKAQGDSPLKRDILTEARAWIDSEADDEEHEELGQEIMEELFEHLECMAPDYCYFGSHVGDGSDYGFWVCEDFQERMRDDDVAQVSDLSELPDTFRGMALHVNDHGNCTLYYTDAAGVLTEIWSVV